MAVSDDRTSVDRDRTNPSLRLGAARRVLAVEDSPVMLSAAVLDLELLGWSTTDRSWL
jgi:hypothetical protein